MRIFIHAIAAALAAVLFVCSAGAEDLDRTLFVIALASQDGKPYERAVMLSRPVRHGHVGVLLNQPLSSTMGDLFPEVAGKSAKVPLFFGGPESPQRVFAMVRAEEQPSQRSVPLLPGVWLVTDGVTIDRILDTAPDTARFFLGFVYWEPGELAEEISKGMMAVRAADAEKLYLEDTSRLYDQVVPLGRGAMPAAQPDAGRLQ